MVVSSKEDSGLKVQKELVVGVHTGTPGYLEEDKAYFFPYILMKSSPTLSAVHVLCVE